MNLLALLVMLLPGLVLILIFFWLKNKQLILGKGAFGEVKLVKEKETNKLFALKIVKSINITKYLR